MTTEVFVAVLTPEANWLVPERGCVSEPERLVKRLGEMDRVLLLAVTAERKRRL